MPMFTSDVQVDNTVLVDGSAVTQPISAVALPLPTGAATNAAVTALTKPTDTQLVDGSAHTQPVSGTFWQATQPVSGSVSVSNFPATQPVSGTVTVANPGLTDTQLRATAVPVSGPLTDTELRATPVPISGSVTVLNEGGGSSALATVTSVSVSPTVATLSASNASKHKVIVWNETGTLYVKLGSAATSSSYSYRLTANSVVEITSYTGIVTAIKASGTTNALVTEIGI